MAALTVVLPTWNRRRVLEQCLQELAEQQADADFEVIVVDNISDDGTPAMVTELARASALRLRLVEQVKRLPLAGSRNLGVEAATGNVLVFMNDDGWPRPGFIARHAAFHARFPDERDAMVGRVVESPLVEMTPFASWLAREFRYSSPEGDWTDVQPGCFFTINASAKASLVRAAGGFDERFQLGYEDTELGIRMAGTGMRLRHDPAAIVEHFHPAGLEATMRQTRAYGTELAKLKTLHPARAYPRPPSLRHRLRAAALNALHAMRLRPPALKQEVWRFLLHETHREALWEGLGSGCEPRIGSRLAARALADPDVATPPAAAPWEPAST